MKLAEGNPRKDAVSNYLSDYKSMREATKGGMPVSNREYLFRLGNATSVIANNADQLRKLNREKNLSLITPVGVTLGTLGGMILGRNSRAASAIAGGLLGGATTATTGIGLADIKTKRTVDAAHRLQRDPGALGATAKLLKKKDEATYAARVAEEQRKNKVKY